MSDDVEGAVGPDRRAFIKRLIIGGAFAVPVVSSFSMSGVQAVFGASAGAQVTNPNTTDPGDDDNENRGDDDRENDDGKKDDGNTSTAQDPGLAGSSSAGAAAAVTADPKLTG